MAIQRQSIVFISGQFDVGVTITEEGNDELIALKGIEALEQLIKEAGLATTFTELGYQLSEDVAKAVSNTCGVSTTGPKELSRQEIFELLMSCR